MELITDWQKAGYKDGKSGKLPAFPENSYARNGYRLGWEKGNQEFTSTCSLEDLVKFNKAYYGG